MSSNSSTSSSEIIMDLILLSLHSSVTQQTSHSTNKVIHAIKLMKKEGMLFKCLRWTEVFVRDRL